MSEPAAEAPPAAQPDSPKPLEERVDAIASQLEKVLNVLGGGGQQAAGSESEPEQPADVKSEVRAELARLQAEEKRKADRDKARAEADARLAAIEEKVKEKPPREYRKITKWHGWAGDDDK